MPVSHEQQIQELDNRLIETDDPAEKARIYLNAGLLFSEADATDEACFFMTQALVFSAHIGKKDIEQQARDYLIKHDRI